MNLAVEEKLLRVLASIEPFSSVQKKVLCLLREEGVAMRKVSRTLELDPLLSSAVLRLANSAFYGMPRQVGHVQDACVLLGVHTLQQLVLPLSVVRAFPLNKGEGLERKALWRHSVGVAVAARILAREAGEDPDLAFTAGLLHDIGRFLLDQCFPGQYVAVLEWREEQRVALWQAEQALWSVDHAEAGAFALRHWRLPEIYAEVAEGHYPQEGDARSRLTWLVHVADILTQGLWISPDNDRYITPLAPHALPALGLDWTQIEALLPEIEQQSQDVISVLLSD